MSTIEINRSNAQHSTGPKTPAGKQRSSKNATSHGLTAQQPLLPNDDPEAYQKHFDSFHDEYDPKGATEEHLVQSLADISWRLNRIVALENHVLSHDTPLEPKIKALANLSLHSQRLSRQFEKTVLELRNLQLPRLGRERADLSVLLKIMDICESKNQPFDPAENGFVFSPAEINAAIVTRNRDSLIDQARAYC